MLLLSCLATVLIHSSDNSYDYRMAFNNTKAGGLLDGFRDRMDKHLDFIGWDKKRPVQVYFMHERKVVWIIEGEKAHLFIKLTDDIKQLKETIKQCIDAKIKDDSPQTAQALLTDPRFEPGIPDGALFVKSMANFMGYYPFISPTTDTDGTKHWHKGTRIFYKACEKDPEIFKEAMDEAGGWGNLIKHYNDLGMPYSFKSFVRENPQFLAELCHAIANKQADISKHWVEDLVELISEVRPDLLRKIKHGIDWNEFMFKEMQHRFNNKDQIYYPHNLFYKACVADPTILLEIDWAGFRKSDKRDDQYLIYYCLNRLAEADPEMFCKVFEKVAKGLTYTWIVTNLHYQKPLLSVFKKACAIDPGFWMEGAEEAMGHKKFMELDPEGCVSCLRNAVLKLHSNGRIEDINAIVEDFGGWRELMQVMQALKGYHISNFDFLELAASKVGGWRELLGIIGTKGIAGIARQRPDLAAKVAKCVGGWSNLLTINKDAMEILSQMFYKNADYAGKIVASFGGWKTLLNPKGIYNVHNVGLILRQLNTRPLFVMQAIREMRGLLRFVRKVGDAKYILGDLAKNSPNAFRAIIAKVGWKEFMKAAPDVAKHILFGEAPEILEDAAEEIGWKELLKMPHPTDPAFKSLASKILHYYYTNVDQRERYMKLIEKALEKVGGFVEFVLLTDGYTLLEPFLKRDDLYKLVNRCEPDEWLKLLTNHPIRKYLL